MSHVASWLVWDLKTGRLVPLDGRCLLRENKITYRVQAHQWEKMVRDGEHAFFGAAVAFRVWKPNVSTIAVIEWPEENGTSSVVWCVRFQMDVALASCYILWPLDHEFATMLYRGFKVNTLPDYSQSSLLEYPPERFKNWRNVSWSSHPNVISQRAIVDDPWTRIFLASIGASHASSSPLEHERLRLQYMRPPEGRPINRVQPKKRGRCFYDMISDDLQHQIVYDLAKELVHTPSHLAHLGWTALRAVSRSFRDASNEAASDLVETLHNRIRAVMESEDQDPIYQLRKAIVPTGLNLWWFVKAFREGVMIGYSSRTALLCYMRARVQKDPRERLPSRPKLGNDLIVMYRECVPTAPCVLRRTRSGAPLCPNVRMKLTTERWRQQFLLKTGWVSGDIDDVAE